MNQHNQPQQPGARQQQQQYPQRRMSQPHRNTLGGLPPPPPPSRSPQQMQLPNYVPFSHPPLLAQLQSQSHHHQRSSPTSYGTHSYHPQQRSGANRHADPFLASPNHAGPPPPATGTTPYHHASTTAPLINFLNVPTAAGGSGSVTPSPSLGDSTSSIGVRDFPFLSSPNQSVSTSGGDMDDFGDIESFLPQSPLTISSPITVSPAKTSTPRRRAAAAAVVPERRVLTRKVEGSGWTLVQPLKSEQAKKDEALRRQHSQNDSEEEESTLDATTASMCGPDRRFGHTAVVRPSTNQMVVFGGRQTGICFDDLWVADLTSVKPDTNPNSIATGAGTTAGSSRPSSKLPIPQATMRWTQIHKPEGDHVVWPSARAGHTAILTEDEELLVFGGGTETDFYGELYSYSFVTAQWTLLKEFDADTKLRNYDLQVKPRKGHTAVWDHSQQSMFVYGGLMSLDQPVKDSNVWKYDRPSNTWSPMPVGGQRSKPSDRAYHVAAFDDRTSSMYVFGGRSIRETPTYPFLGDLHRFNTKTGVWTSIDAPGPDAPPPRMCASGAFANGRFFVSHGGHTRYLNDSYEFDPRRERWSKSTETPSPLTRPTVVIHENTVTVFGGCDHEIFNNDCHQLKLQEPTLFDLCTEWLNDEELIPAEEGCTPPPSSVTLPSSSCFSMPPLSLGQSLLGASSQQRGINSGGLSSNTTLNRPFGVRTSNHHGGLLSSSPLQGPGSSLGTPSSPMMLALQTAGPAPQGGSAFSQYLHGQAQFGGGSLRPHVGGSATSMDSAPGVRLYNGTPPPGDLTDFEAAEEAAAAAGRVQTPLPLNVLKKAQLHLKAQCVLPPPAVHPRDLHIPTQPFF